MKLSWYRNLPFMVVSLMALWVVLSLAWLEPEASQYLAFRRQLIDEGQWWRLYTANWVHFSGYHVAMNVLGLGAIYYFLFWRRHELAWWVSLAVVPWCVGAGLYLLNPELEEYRGFSAAAYGTLMAGFILEWRYSRLMMSVALAFLAVKIGYEQLPGYDVNYLREEIGVEVAVDAHLWGSVGGLFIGLICLAWEWWCDREKLRDAATQTPES